MRQAGNSAGHVDWNWRSVSVCDFVGIFFTKPDILTRFLYQQFPKNGIVLRLHRSISVYKKCKSKIVIFLGVRHIHSWYWAWRHDCEYSTVLAVAFVITMMT